MARKKRPLVPGAEDALAKLKAQVISDQASSATTTGPSRIRDSAHTTASAQQGSVSALAHQLGIPYAEDRKNSDMKSGDAGKLGGNIGGPMVKRLIELAETQLQRDAAPRR